MVFGGLVDSSCITNILPGGLTGACLLYDMDLFRYNMHSFALGLKMIATVLCCAAYLIDVCRIRRQENGKDLNMDGEAMA